MENNKKIGIYIILISIIIYAVVLLFKIYSPVTYFIVLVSLSLSVFYIQKYDVLSANFMFLLMFIYTVGLGPIILMFKGVQYNYDFYKIILGGFLAFCLGNLLFPNYKNILKTMNIKD